MKQREMQVGRQYLATIEGCKVLVQLDSIVEVRLNRMLVSGKFATRLEYCVRRLDTGECVTFKTTTLFAEATMLTWKQSTVNKAGTTDSDIWAGINKGRKAPQWLWIVGPRSGSRSSFRHGRANTREEAVMMCEKIASEMRGAK